MFKWSAGQWSTHCHAGSARAGHYSYRTDVTGRTGIATGSWRSTDHIEWSAVDSAHRPSDGSDNTDSESRGTDATDHHTAAERWPGAVGRQSDNSERADDHLPDDAADVTSGNDGPATSPTTARGATAATDTGDTTAGQRTNNPVAAVSCQSSPTEWQP